MLRFYNFTLHILATNWI